MNKNLLEKAFYHFKQFEKVKECQMSCHIVATFLLTLSKFINN